MRDEHKPVYAASSNPLLNNASSDMEMDDRDALKTPGYKQMNRESWQKWRSQDAYNQHSAAA